MSGQQRVSGGRLAEFYRRHIGSPTTTDEVYGYLAFAVGLLLSIVGVVVFVSTLDQPPTAGVFAVREAALVVAGVGLIALVASVVVRFPLRAQATWLAAAGSLVSLGGLVVFVGAYPWEWRLDAPGVRTSLLLYVGGLAIVAVAAVVVPLVTGPTPTDRYHLEIYQDDGWYWQIRQGGSVVAASDTRWESEAAARDAARETLETMADATLVVEAGDEE